jgi:PAS domain S-box-containing protein
LSSLSNQQSFAGTGSETSLLGEKWERIGWQIALTLSYTSLAVLGNIVSIDLFFGVNFLFGTIFVWLCWIFLGPISALFTAIAAAYYTVLLWGHYYAFGIFILEFLFIATLLRRERDTSKIALGLVAYWLLLGAPLSYAAYRHGLGLPQSTWMIVVSKQVLNSLLNACAAIFLFNAFAKKPQCRISKRTREVGIHVQSPSYSALIQSSIILLILVSTGLAELFAIRKSFDLRIAANHAEVTRAASALRANGLHFLAMETQYWAMHHDHPHAVQPSTKASREGGIETYAPIGLYKLSDTSKLVRITGAPLDALNQRARELVLTRPKDGNDTTQLLDCSKGTMLVALRGSSPSQDYFSLWPLEVLSALTAGAVDEDIMLSCGASSAPSDGEFKVWTTRDTSGDIPALRSWLAGTAQTSFAISETPKIALTVSKGIRNSVVEFHAEYAQVLLRLTIIAMALICLVYFLGIRLNLWLDRFARETENFVRTGEISQRALSARFQEDRRTVQWVKRLDALIKEKEKSELLAIRNFNAVIQSSKVPIFATDQSGNICVWNSMMQELTGFSLREVKGKKILGLIDSSDSSPEDLAVLFGEIAPKSASHSFSFSLITKDGRQLYLQTGRTFLHDVSTAVQRGVTSHSGLAQNRNYFVAQDNTEAKVAQANILHAARLTALGEMAATFAHELNQPLNAIALASGNGMAELHQAKPNLASINKKFERIEDQAIRAGEVIQTIRQFVLQSDQLKTTTFDILEILDNALESTKESMRVNSVKLKKSKPSQNATVEGNALMLEQSIMAILINAQQAVCGNASDNREINIECGNNVCDTCERQCHSSFEEEDSLSAHKAMMIKFTDNGPGIPERILHEVFEPFVTSKPEEEGTGLGLYMAKTAVEAMQGSIRAKNTETGAEVMICLPLK